MKIAIAQSRPVVGPVEGNLTAHQSLINLACQYGAQLIVFPELSLTGYEPRMATSLARLPGEPCFAGLQQSSDRGGISIAVGAPTTGLRQPRISTLLFRPLAKPLVHSKHYLHADETPFFEPGPKTEGMLHKEPHVALAICYELSIPEHIECAVNSGADVYVASVAKHDEGVEKAYRRLSEISARHSVVSMMANCLGELDGEDCVGKSAVWNQNGEMIAQLDTENEGVIVLDYETESVAVATKSAITK